MLVKVRDNRLSPNRNAAKSRDKSPFFCEHEFKPSFVSCEFMLEEFCEGNHCDQYIHSIGGLFAQCLMVQRELSRVGSCPLRYDRIVVKSIPEERTRSPGELKSEPKKKGGFAIRSR